MLLPLLLHLLPLPPLLLLLPLLPLLLLLLLLCRIVDPDRKSRRNRMMMALFHSYLIMSKTSRGSTLSTPTNVEANDGNGSDN